MRRSFPGCDLPRPVQVRPAIMHLCVRRSRFSRRHLDFHWLLHQQIGKCQRLSSVVLVMSQSQPQLYSERHPKFPSQRILLFVFLLFKIALHQMKDVKACLSSKFQRIQMLGLPRTQCETVAAETTLDVEQMGCSASPSAGTAALWKT